MNVQKVKKKPLVALLGLLLCLCVVVGLVPNITAHAVSNSLDVSSSTVTGYYIKIKTANLVCKLDNKKFMTRNWGEFDAWKRTDKNASVVFSFDNIIFHDKELNADMKVIATAFLGLNFPGSRTTSKEVSFLKDTEINIRKSYYNLFKQEMEKGTKLNSFKLTLLWPDAGSQFLSQNNWPFPILNFDCAVSLEERELPPGVDDPEDPDFVLGDNGGITTDSEKKSSLDKFWAWFRSIWGSKDPFKIVAQIVFVVLGVFLLGVFIKIIRFVLGVFK